jgi:hypothetical protein
MQLLWPLVSVVQSGEFVAYLSFGTQLLAVTQMSVGAVTVNVYVFKHGCGAT